jgi:hypothetical protein
MFEINCKGALGIGYRRISVEGKISTPPPSNPPPSSGGGGGRWRTSISLLLSVFGFLAAICQLRAAESHFSPAGTPSMLRPADAAAGIAHRIII